MAAATLYDYYTAKGQTLPSLSTRATLYQNAGLGSSASYAGTAAQNTALLGYLQKAPTAAPTTPAPRTVDMGTPSVNTPAPAPAPTPAPAQTNTADTSRSRSLDTSMPTPPTIPTYQAPSFSASPVSAAPNDAHYTQFNAALMGLLKTQQGMGTKGFQEQGFNAQQAMNDKVLAPTSSDFVGAAPGTQDSVRSGQAQAIQPLVTGANNAGQTFGQQINSLGDAINAAKSFGDSYQTHQDNMQQQARDNITQAMQIGGAAGLEAMDKANPNIFKVAGLDYDSLIAAAKAQEKYQQDLKTYDLQNAQYNAASSKPIEVNAGNTLVNPKTGEVIYSGTGGSAGTTTTAGGLQSGKTFVSGSFKYTGDQYNQDKAALLATRGADGWVDPAVYLRGLKSWLAAGGLQSDYLQVYPIKDFINPVNTWPEILALGGGTKPKVLKGTATTTSTRSA